MDIVLATNNSGKKKEIVSLLNDLAIKIHVHLIDDFPGCKMSEETGKTFEENAVKKALEVAGRKFTRAVMIQATLDLYKRAIQNSKVY